MKVGFYKWNTNAQAKNNFCQVWQIYYYENKVYLIPHANADILVKGTVSA